MRLRINGEPLDLDLGDRPTVAALLERVGPRNIPCAVELNRSLVPLARRAETAVAEGDRVEIVTLVGGG